MNKIYTGVTLEHVTVKKLKRAKPKKMTMTEFVESLLAYQKNK